jgi:hypothetical protein
VRADNAESVLPRALNGHLRGLVKHQHASRVVAVDERGQPRLFLNHRGCSVCMLVQASRRYLDDALVVVTQLGMHQHLHEHSAWHISAVSNRLGIAAETHATISSRAPPAAHPPQPPSTPAS